MLVNFGQDTRFLNSQFCLNLVHRLCTPLLLQVRAKARVQPRKGSTCRRSGTRSSRWRRTGRAPSPWSSIVPLAKQQGAFWTVFQQRFRWCSLKSSSIFSKSILYLSMIVSHIRDLNITFLNTRRLSFSANFWENSRKYWHTVAKSPSSREIDDIELNSSKTRAKFLKTPS